MRLHEAVQAARKDLRLSQKKLAEMAGIQRRQLATLEAGGNITLATLRKVLAQLPNLETFTLDAVTATVRREVSEPEQHEIVAKALELMGRAITGVTRATKAGRRPTEREMRVFAQASELLHTGLGYEPEDIRRDGDRISTHHLMHPETAQGPAGELANAIKTAELEVERQRAAEGLRAEGIDPDSIPAASDDDGGE